MVNASLAVRALYLVVRFQKGQKGIKGDKKWVVSLTKEAFTSF